MMASLFAWAYALVIFMLMTEVDSTWLKWVGFIFGGWMVIVACIAGYQATRR